MTGLIQQTFASFDDREGLFSRVLTKLNSRWVAATYPFAGKGRNFSFHHASDIPRALSPHFRIGDRVEIGKHTWFHTWCTRCRKNDHEVTITIDEDCRLGPRCTITSENSIHLERGVALESDVLLMDHAHAYQDVTRSIFDQGATPGGRIRIKEGCRIGRGAAILCEKGELVLGKNSVVAPGAVVTRSFPPDSMLAGNPARMVRQPGAGAVRSEQKAPLVASGSSPETSLAARPGTPEVSEEALPVLVPDGVNEDPLTFFSRGVGKMWTLWLKHAYPFAYFGKGVWAHYSMKVARSAAKYISLGEKAGFGRGSRLEVEALSGTQAPVIILEKGSGMQRRCLISARNRIHVMQDVMFGPSVLVTDHGTVLESQAGTSVPRIAKESSGGTIRIEAECWIGFGVVIHCEQGELVIGKHCVVGANSVITRSIPPFSIVAGNPARIVKQYDFAREQWVLGCIRPLAPSVQEQPAPVAGALS